ncbi:AMP-binding protein [uncultured Lutibacter sp.]|uniref:AMP-binding protein n=1 Tax=uncultured Lutibacter sp. TaxID=437739 RepID=UPI002624144B|nr:AMP-binding protein [uncultured Lutibacter sp.]
MKADSSFHINFKLQGRSFSSKEELIDFSFEISSEVQIFLKQWFNEENFVQVKTSGSTGKPKLIQLQKKHMINSALATGTYFNLPENTTALLCMSPNFIAGKMMFVRALTLGWNLDVVQPNSNPLKNINKQYDFSAMVPLQLFNSISQINFIKKLIVGGGVVSNELLNKIQNIDTEVFATYGMTETITHIAVKKLNNFNSVISNADEKSHYKILPNITISKDNRDCLVIDAPKVSNELVITNDLVELISLKEFKWLGRFDTIINSGGIKLIPEQIEEKFSKIIHQRFFVAGITDELLGEKLILVIESSSDTVSSDEILWNIKNLKLVTRFEIPKEIYFIEQFVETPTNKIHRTETLKLL